MFHSIKYESPSVTFRGFCDDILRHSQTSPCTPPSPSALPDLCLYCLCPIPMSLLTLFLLGNVLSHSHYFLSRCYSFFNTPVQVPPLSGSQPHILARKSLPPLYSQSTFLLLYCCRSFLMIYFILPLNPSDSKES